MKIGTHKKKQFQLFKQQNKITKIQQLSKQAGNGKANAYENYEELSSKVYKSLNSKCDVEMFLE